MRKAAVWLLSLSLAFQAAGILLGVWQDRIPWIHEIAEGPHERAVTGLTTLRTSGSLAPGEVGFQELAGAFSERQHDIDRDDGNYRIVDLSWRRAPYESNSYVAPSYAYPIVATFSDRWTDAMDPRNMVSHVDGLTRRLDGLWTLAVCFGVVLGIIGAGLNRRWAREHPTEVAPREKLLPPWRS